MVLRNQISEIPSVDSTAPRRLGLYKIFVYVEAVVHESTILSPHPPALLTLLQCYCASIGQYTTPLPTSRVYATHHTILRIPMR